MVQSIHQMDESSQTAIDEKISNVWHFCFILGICVCGNRLSLVLALYARWSGWMSAIDQSQKYEITPLYVRS